MVFRFLRSPKAGGRQQQSEAISKEPAAFESELTGDEAQTTVATILASDGTSGDETTSSVILTQGLGEVDEHFFQELAEDLEEPPELPPRPGVSEDIGSADSEGHESPEGLAAKRKWADFIWDSLPSTPGIPESLTWRASSNDREKMQAADDLMAAAVAIKAQQSDDTSRTTVADPDDPHTHVDAQKDQNEDQDEHQGQAEEQQRRELDSVLKNLSFSAVNDRIVSLSEDSQILLQRFTQILRDMVNGVPTAYRDFDTLFAEKHAQLDKLYRSMPNFMQKLIRTELQSWWKVTYPTLLFAARNKFKVASSTGEGALNTSSTSTGEAVKAASVSVDGEQYARLNGTSSSTSQAGKAAPVTIHGGTSAQNTSNISSSKAKRPSIVSLRRLIPGRGAVVAMLQSILAFLRTRFPLLLAGSNLLVGFAVLILLLVCWYCYSRGRETRLANEEQGQKDSKPSAAAAANPPESDLHPPAESTPPAESESLSSNNEAEAEASQDAASLQALQSVTTLEESSRLAVLHDSAAKVKLPHAIPLPEVASSGVTATREGNEL